MHKFMFIIFCLFLIAVPQQVKAQEDVKISKSNIDLANTVMMAIYTDVLEQRDKFGELRNFTRAVLSENEHGIYVFDYRYRDLSSSASDQEFRLGLTISTLDSPNLSPSRRRSFQHDFPLLNLKVDGYQYKTFMKQIDFKALVDRHILPLLKEEQKLMPLLLELQPVRSVFKIGRPIVFDVTLKNVSDRSLKVKRLSAKTLKFWINREPWDLDNIDRNERVRYLVLKPGDSTTVTLTGKPVSTASQFSIKCLYALTHQGVHPADVMKIVVQ